MISCDLESKEDGEQDEEKAPDVQKLRWTDFFFLFLNPIFAFKDSIYWVTFTLFLRKSGKKARTNLLGQKAGF